jgi:metal-sulfur cluster biosynthetic enzyme
MGQQHSTFVYDDKHDGTRLDVEKVATASTCPSTTAGLQQQEQMVDDVPIRDMHVKTGTNG